MLDLLGWYTLKVVPYQLLRKHNTPDNASGVPRTSVYVCVGLSTGSHPRHRDRKHSLHGLQYSPPAPTPKMSHDLCPSGSTGRGAGNVWTAHDKEETSAKMNSSTSVMLTKLRMFTRNLLFKCVDSFHIHELRLPCSGSCVNSSPKPQLSITGQWLEFQSNTGALKLNREASIVQRCNNTDNVLNPDCQTFNIYHSLLRLVHELHQRKESIHI